MIGRTAMMAILLLGQGAGLVAAAEGEAGPKHVRRIDLVHMTHTDIGFTDHPLVCRRQQMRYLDIAIDAVLATRDRPRGARFFWTAETTLAVDDWWQAADAERREDLLKAIDTGQLEIAAVAMNQTPTLNAVQWGTMLNWIADEVWDRAGELIAISRQIAQFRTAS